MTNNNLKNLKRILLSNDVDIIEEKTVYHGTPYKFDKFSLDYIGKGEGHQAFGWGLYFAENKEIADKAYREVLSTNDKIPPNIIFNNNIWKANENKKYIVRNDIDLSKNPNSVTDDIKKEYTFINMVKDNNYDINKTLNFYKKLLNITDESSKPFLIKGKSPEEIKELVNFYLNANIELNENKGYLYEVDIPDDYENYFLDLDDDFQYMNENIKNKLVSLFTDLKIYDNIIGDKLRTKLEREHLSGSDIYKFLGKQFHSDKKASLKLLEYDIKGNIFYDGDESTQNELGGHTEESKRNFVIWDESIISKM